MLTKEISSLQHPIVKHFVNLRKNRTFREENNTVCIIGSTLIQELQPFSSFKTILWEKSTPVPKGIKADVLLLVPQEILEKISGMKNPSHAIAEVRKPQNQSLENKNFILVLDHISDPGNLGTLIRSALALGWEGVFISSDSCDPFNEKALKAAKGATFKLPIEIAPMEKLLSQKRTFYVADAKGASIQGQNFPSPLALILGNEANGPSDAAKKNSLLISIPISKEMESLNVASAGAILLYELRKLS